MAGEKITNGVPYGEKYSKTEKPKGTFYSVVAALRPWSFSASLVPVALGSMLAYKDSGYFNVWIFIVTCLTALSVHGAGNLVNTYFDYMKGVDGSKSDDRTLVDHILAPNDVAQLGAALYTVGCAGFVLLVYLSPAKMEHLALLYFGGLSGSFLYTGGLGLKYIALGDIAIFLTFGPVTVMFSFLAQCGKLSLLPLWYAVPLALNTEAILHCNNTRDMETDKASGIITLAILIGRTASYLLFVLLLFSPYISLFVLALHYSGWFLLPVLSIFPAFSRERDFREGRLRRLPQKLAQLNIVFGLSYVLACFLAKGSMLPGMRH
ncbi:ubiA prenyltransferase domain-containing protein 1 [Lingula anatina]|uniref:UbiA prenyltransferase domain-containing protein 1 n=1 Tax=Lingula anatina TaxID=7574 RepID=A0A1S3K295_LINAN|nr:ubiA prenyltransferase domain-containing protein 1 [Lingula anatina]XP_013416519.1 ubiA prenyltransferase domain-containing protein 1 [Lingula anatina]|eukprot:XP_013395601.1 ubiA prenyltransferase domain-containing protein 1 [Lingula anatina]